MFHLIVFSITIYKICNSSHNLLVCVIFPDLEMRRDRWCKWYILSQNVCNFGWYLYFSVLVSSASFLLLGFFRYTLWPLYLKQIFGNCESSSFLIKIFPNSSDICVLTFSARKYLVVEKCSNHHWISFLLFYRFEYKTPSRFNDLVLAWTAYLKYLYSFKELYHST